MSPEFSSKKMVQRIALKEIILFFSSPIAYLFLGSFAGVTLFVFFWGEAFFARNIADVRPLFEWMPILLIFLASTLTMRSWSEERRSGTLEQVLTLPVPIWAFVLGKFLGCLALLALALLITLPLPFTVSVLGDLDWGPVWTGYLAALLLGAAYLAAGLFVSALSANQIVSLLSAVGLTGMLYLIGTPLLTGLINDPLGSALRSLGTGSRFEAITRGVVDLRDFGFYLGLTLVFLSLNALVLESERWSEQRSSPRRRTWSTVCWLLVANAVGLNLWLGQLTGLRLDVTQGKQYSITGPTKQILDDLQEPLLLRGYFSEKTHPLLAPLIPQLKDLLQEYAVVGGKRVRVEFVDPNISPEAEEQAYQDFGIQPVPFQIADRHQASIVSSYFHVLVKYGDEHRVLSFQDLIEFRARSVGDLQVQLRNPEYDLSKAIKKVSESFRSDGDLFANLEEAVSLKAYVSEAGKLPESLRDFHQVVVEVAEQLSQDSNGLFSIEVVDPEANSGELATQLVRDFGFRPMAADLFSPDRFYFYLTLQQGERVLSLPLDDLSSGSFERNLRAGLKRFAPGMGKTVALVKPQGPDAPSFERFEEFLKSELSVVSEDLHQGQVPGMVDLLLLLAPKELDEKQVFAVDQFLMKGGTVILATSPFEVSVGREGISLKERESGLEDWLEHHGLSIAESMVLDPQCAALAIPTTRFLGGRPIQEIRMLDYPFFLDLRRSGMTEQEGLLGDLLQVTVPWASPIRIQESEDQDTTPQTLEFLKSSSLSWSSASRDISPRGPELGGYHPVGAEQQQTVGTLSQGRFTSYFKNRSTPDLETGSVQVLEHSPESAKLVLISSNDLIRDEVIALLSSAQGSNYLNSLQLLSNLVDWAFDEGNLSSIRARGHFNRTLPPLDRQQQLFWEYLNYGLVLMALLGLAGATKLAERRRKRRFQVMMDSKEDTHA